MFPEQSQSTPELHIAKGASPNLGLTARPFVVFAGSTCVREPKQSGRSYWAGGFERYACLRQLSFSAVSRRASPLSDCYTRRECKK